MYNCEYNDCGWCYHKDTPFPYECVGTANCSVRYDIIVTDKDNDND